jgi:hypothetical protein
MSPCRTVFWSDRSMKQTVWLHPLRGGAPTEKVTLPVAARDQPPPLRSVGMALRTLETPIGRTA